MAIDQSKASAGATAPPPASKGAAARQSGDAERSGQAQGDTVLNLQSAAESTQRETGRSGDRPPERRGAGTARRHVAANDDLPSIGGLIFALQQRPSRSTFAYALVASLVWLVLSSSLGWALFNSQLAELGWAGSVGSPLVMLLLASICIPIALFWFLALLIWRAQELRLMASAMTEVAVRLAEPDRMAEQSVASVGQTIRRQVAAMNDALSRALGRAGELEALVHNEVAALERSYNENELRIRGLIDELSSERQALANNSERVSEALRGMGSQVAKDIMTAGEQATRSLVSATATISDTLLAKGEKITAAVSAAGQSIDRKLAERGAQVTEQMVGQGAQISERLQKTSQQVTSELQQSTQQLASTFTDASRQVSTELQQSAQDVTITLTETTRQVTASVEDKRNALVQVFDNLSQNMNKEVPALLNQLENEQARLNAILEVANQTFEALESSLAQRTLALDSSLKQRTQAIQATLTERIHALDEALGLGAQAIDQSLEQRSQALNLSLEEKSYLLDQSLEQKSQALTRALDERSYAIDQSLTHRSQSLDRSLEEKSYAIDQSLAQRSQALTLSLEEKLVALDQALEQRSAAIEHTLMENTSSVERSLVRHTMALSQLLAEGTEAVRQSTDQLATQSIQAADNLTNQADLLKDVSKRMLEQIHSLTQRFENQGHAIMSAAQALDSSNARIDSILQRRHGEIATLLETVSEKARDLDAMMHSYSDMIESALTRAEGRAKEVTASLAHDTAVQSRAAVNQIEQMRAEALAHTENAVAELKQGFEAITGQVAEQVATLSSRFGVATEEMRSTAYKTAEDMEKTRQELQRRIRDLPEETKQSAEAVRKVLAEQLQALSSLSAIAAEQGVRRDMAALAAPQPPSNAPVADARQAPYAARGEPWATTGAPVDPVPPPASRPAPAAFAPVSPAAPPAPAEPPEAAEIVRAAPEAPRAPAAPTPSAAPFSPPPFTPPGIAPAGQGAQPAPPEPPIRPQWQSAVAVEEDMGSVTADLARQLSSAYPPERMRPAAAPGPGEGSQGNGAREQWSLGDLLKRASEPEPAPIQPAPPVPPAPPLPRLDGGGQPRNQPTELRLEDLAGIIDERMAATFWQRYRRGERDILSRDTYAPQGRETFDDIARRYQREPEFKATVERYMADFERLLQEAQARHRDGRGVRHYLLSETGRVYLLLAHASCRLR